MRGKARAIIFATVDHLIEGFLYYDRKEDEDMPEDFIESAIKNGYVTVDEIVQRFREQLKEGLEEE